MKRRDAIKKTLLAGTTLTLVPSLFHGCSKKEDEKNDGPVVIFTIDLADQTYAALKNTWGSYVITTKSIIVVHSSIGQYWAFESKCTHNGCTIQVVNPPLSSALFHCPCHNSFFDDYGKVTSGPATVNLIEYNATKSGNILTITNKT